MMSAFRNRHLRAETCSEARRFARHGVALEAGQVILAGSFTRALPVTPGDVFHADYGRLGGFGFSFAADDGQEA